MYLIGSESNPQNQSHQWNQAAGTERTALFYGVGVSDTVVGPSKQVNKDRS